jgi:hypothetical protein
MNITQIKSKYKLGQFIQGKVEHHLPFGIFVNIGEADIKGLIKIPDFLDEGVMKPSMYPEIGATVGAIEYTWDFVECRHCRRFHLLETNYDSSNPPVEKGDNESLYPLFYVAVD